MDINKLGLDLMTLYGMGAFTPIRRIMNDVREDREWQRTLDIMNAQNNMFAQMRRDGCRFDGLPTFDDV